MYEDRPQISLNVYKYTYVIDYHVTRFLHQQ